MRQFVEISLRKAEDPQAYKKIAEKGLMISHPVSIGGHSHRHDNGIHYHSTIKFFDPDKDSPHDVHHIASKLPLHAPDPKQVHIEPGMFKDRFNNDVYVIKMHQGAEHMKEHHKQFAHLGHKENFEYTPHISVDKATHDKIKASGAKTAHEAGITFGPAQLTQGHKTLHTYHPQEEKMAASEEMNKAISPKHIGAAFGIMGSLAGSPNIAAKESHIPTNTAHVSAKATPTSTYTPKRMLAAISSVESAGGKLTNHRALSGPIHRGEHALGQYGITPDMARETIRLNPDLRKKHKQAMHLRGELMHNYFQDHPGLEDAIASKHLHRLERHFGQNPEKIGYAWLNGISSTHKAINEGKDINNHWHAKRIRNAYDSIK